MADFGMNNKFALLGDVEDEEEVAAKPVVKSPVDKKASRPRGGRPGKREKDRHVSGSGRNDTEKRGGAGKYNWGEHDGQPREIAAEETAAAEAIAEVEEPEVAYEEEPEPEPEEVEMTFEEYQNARQKVEDDEQLEIRKVDDSELKSLVDIKSKKASAIAEEDSEFLALQKKKGKVSKKESKKKEVASVVFDQVFAPAQRFDQEERRGGRGGRGRGGRGTGRGGRGAGRGGRGRGAGRGGAARGDRSSAAPRVNIGDQQAFPSLA